MPPVGSLGVDPAFRLETHRVWVSRAGSLAPTHQHIALLVCIYPHRPYISIWTSSAQHLRSILIFLSESVSVPKWPSES